MKILKLIIISIITSGAISLGEEKEAAPKQKPLTKEVWDKYFKIEHRKKNQTWKVKMNIPLLGGATTAKLIEKFKGEKDGWLQLASVVVGGPMDGQQNKAQFKITEKGQILKKEDKEILNVPYPLSIGQSWKSDDETVVFQGFEDYETPTQTIAKCIIFKAKDKNGTTTRWYSVDHGYFFSDSDLEMGAATRILDTIK